MVKMYPGRAKRMTGLRRNPIWNTNKLKTGYGFYKTNPGRWKWGGLAQNAANTTGSYHSLKVEGMISNTYRTVDSLPGVPAEKLEKWWYLDQNLLPPDEKQPPTDDEMEEKASDEIAPIETTYRTLIEDIKDEAENDSARLIAEAQIFENDWDPKTRPNSLAKARRRYDQELEVRIEANRQIAFKAQEFKDQRDEVKARLKKEQLEAIETANDRVQQLKAEMEKEIQECCDAYFEAGDNGRAACKFELSDWDLS